MNRRGFIRSLTAIPFSGLAVDIISETFQRGVALPVKPITQNYPELVGYKGDQFFDGGYVYYPYIPLVQTCNLYETHYNRS